MLVVTVTVRSLTITDTLGKSLLTTAAEDMVHSQFEAGMEPPLEWSFFAGPPAPVKLTSRFHKTNDNHFRLRVR